MLLHDLREQVITAGLEANRQGIVHGTAGNFSIRDLETGLIAISPTGMPYGAMTAADVVIVDTECRVHDGHRKPSSETPMHTMIMAAHPEINCIVHTHSHYSTVVGTIRSALPPILNETVIVIGAYVPVTRFGETGTPDIGHSVLEVMTPGSKAVLMKNHGLICFGETFGMALLFAQITEEAAKAYINALAANGGREPDMVPEHLIPKMTAHFLDSYGQETRIVHQAVALDQS